MEVNPAHFSFISEIFGKIRKGQEFPNGEEDVNNSAVPWAEPSYVQRNGDITGFISKVKNIPVKYIKRFETPAQIEGCLEETKGGSGASANSSVINLVPSNDSLYEYEDAGVQSDTSSDRVLPFENLDSDLLTAEIQMLSDNFQILDVESSIDSLSSSAFDTENDDKGANDNNHENIVIEESNDQDHQRNRSLPRSARARSSSEAQDESDDDIAVDSADGGYYSRNNSEIILNAVVKCEGDTELENWEPMIAFHDSTKNIKCFDAETTLKGIPHFRGAICPYSEGQTCYKGERCPCEHHIDRRKVSANPKMALPVEPLRVTHFSILPSKVPAEYGACFFAKITCVNAINDFYFTPLNGVGCECKKHDRDYKMRAKDGINTLDTITAEMNAYFSKHSAKFASSYGFMELTAVRIFYEGNLGYYRAAVLESTVVDSEDYPESLCYLVDIGHKLSIKMNQFQILPKIFCDIPPLAYNCSLLGVSPSQAWGKGKAGEIFMAAVDAPRVLVRIRRLCYVEDASALCYTESIPYAADVFVWDDQNDRYRNVVHELVESRAVLPWTSGHSEDEVEKIKYSPNCYNDGTDTAGCYHDENMEFIRQRHYSVYGFRPRDKDDEVVLSDFHPSLLDPIPNDLLR